MTLKQDLRCVGCQSGGCGHHPGVPHHPSRHHLLTYFSGVFGKRKESSHRVIPTPIPHTFLWCQLREIVRPEMRRPSDRNLSVAFRNHQRRHMPPLSSQCTYVRIIHVQRDDSQSFVPIQLSRVCSLMQATNFRATNGVVR